MKTGRIKTLSILLLSPLLAVGVARFCHHKTAGFQISKITSNFYTTQISSCTEEEKALMLPILSQKFYYLNRGLQSFVFVSEDGKYVLKLLNNLYQRRLFWLNLLPFHTSRLTEKLLHNQMRLESSFRSYRLAYELLKEETGLIAMHTEPTSNLQSRVTIVDKLGIHHSIDLDQSAFLIQKKATLVFAALNEMMQRGATLEAKEALTSLMQLIHYKFNCGIADNDPLIRTNFGFVEGRAVQIDVGPFSLDQRAKDPEVYVPEIERITASLKEWLNNNYPELLEYVK